ncbi:hypothetical protein O1Q96_24110 [Streptomyces sp. Qhu-G9]|uniref:hypothetical protein n=1 Tax=Streptomyces sp. Qhu-G9 TaxID=3452799 RepID=UPI0022AC2E3E|nr:hypothetical protein [Streptomyces aurantiacus]WAU82556.1 hypothetical protein O1Q96_24110 [Streptomyces aurantiacus]
MVVFIALGLLRWVTGPMVSLGRCGRAGDGARAPGALAVHREGPGPGRIGAEQVGEPARAAAGNGVAGSGLATPPAR